MTTRFLEEPGELARHARVGELARPRPRMSMLEELGRARFVSHGEPCACAVELEARGAGGAPLERCLGLEQRGEPRLVTVDDRMIDEGAANRPDPGLQLERALERGDGGAGVCEAAVEHDPALDVEPRGRPRLTGKPRETPQQGRELRPALRALERRLEAGESAGVVGDQRERRDVRLRGLGGSTASRLEQPRLLGEEVGANEGVGDVRDQMLDMHQLRVDGGGLSSCRERAKERVNRGSVLDEGGRACRRSEGRIRATLRERGPRERQLGAHRRHRVRAVGERGGPCAEKRGGRALAFDVLERCAARHIQEVTSRRKCDRRTVERWRDDTVGASEHRGRARVDRRTEDRCAILGDRGTVVVLDERAAVEHDSSGITGEGGSGPGHGRQRTSVGRARTT